MAYINLSTPTNRLFPNAANNDVQFYTTTSTNTFFIGASNSQNYVQVGPTLTTLSNVQMTNSMSSNATVSNLVITGAIWSSNAYGLTQYSVGGGGGSTSLSSDISINSVTTTSSSTNFLNVNGEIVISNGPSQSNIVLPNGTFTTLLASNVTATQNLTVSAAGQISFPSSSLQGTYLNPTTSSTLNGLTLNTLTMLTSNVTFMPRTIPFQSIDAAHIPASSIAWNAIDPNTVGGIAWSSLDQITVPPFIVGSGTGNNDVNATNVIAATTTANVMNVMGELIINPGTTVTSTTTYGTFNTLKVTGNVLVSNGGYIGVNNSTPSCEIDVLGTIKATTVINSSDARIKTNVQPFVASRTLLDQLSPVTYSFIDDPSNKTHLGLIAQEVENVFPLAVETLSEFVPATEDSLIIGDEVKFASGEIAIVETLVPTITYNPAPAPDSPPIVTHKKVHDFKAINYGALVTALIASFKASVST